VEYAWARIEGTKESEKEKEAVGGGSYEGGRGPILGFLLACCVSVVGFGFNLILHP
jgi:hypothetical protein